MNRNVRVLSAIGILAVLGAGCATPSAQPAQAVTVRMWGPFRIVVGFTDEEIVLECTQGCAWTDTSWGPVGPAFDAVAVDAFGMTSTSRVLGEREFDALQESGLALFLITVQRTEDGVQLRGLEGSLWTDLGWTCESCSVAVDGRGML